MENTQNNAHKTVFMGTTQDNAHTSPVALEEREKQDIVNIGEQAADLPKRALLNNDGTISYTLIEPIAITTRDTAGHEETTEYKTLTLHPLRGKDLRDIQKANSDMMNIVTFAASARLARPIMARLYDEMLAADAVGIDQALSFFINQR